jgi:hypothetical protein
MVAGTRADHRQDRPHGFGVEVLVLRREGVDGGRDDPDPLLVETLPDELLAGEDVGVGVGHVGAQEIPGGAGQLAGPVDPDVAAPDHLDVGRNHLRHETGRLRVVDVDDVSRLDQRGELVRGLGQGPVIHVALLRPQRPTVSLRLMEAVVDSLRDPEKVGASRDRHPAHVHARSARVGE